MAHLVHDMKSYTTKKVFQTKSRDDFFKHLGGCKRVLDLGCGSGQNSKNLKEMFPHLEISAIDIIDTPTAAPFVDYRKVDLDAGVIPFPSAYFDAVLFVHVIEHLHSSWPLGYEINRVLRKGGSIYVETPNWTSMLVPSFGFRRDQHNPFNFFDDPTHVKPWTKHGLYEFLNQGCALDVEKISTVRNWTRLLFDIPIILYSIFRQDRPMIVSSFWNLFGWAIYATATKR